MKAPRLWSIVPALLVAGVVGVAYAKLPPPPPVDPAKAEAAKQKAAEAAKKEAEALNRAMDRVAERHKKEKGIKAAAPAATPAKKN